LLKGLLPILVFGGAGWTVRTLYLTRPAAEKAEAVARVPVVSVIDLAPRDEKIVIQAFGTVIPAQRVSLQTEVSGRIVNQHPALVPGGLIPAGSEVLRIDPTDYELRVKQEEVALESANAAFELERGQNVVAAKEWALLKDEIDAPQEMADFALRKPQRRMAQARVEAAKNRLALATLDLERTVLTTPFNALVLEEFVDRGQLVSPQALVANLVGTDRFWVQVSVPLDRLGRIGFSDDAGNGGSPAEVYVDAGDQPRPPRSARVLRLLGDLSERGRMARVLIGIDDPLNLAPEADSDAQPVLLNSYVRVAIDAGAVHDVCEIPRVALRENDQVWVQDASGLLRVCDVDVVWRRPNSVLVANRFSDREKLIVSRLAVVLPGMPVRVGRLPGSTDGPEALGLSDRVPLEPS
jgi:multidrug efflux pump subunit AcrA (membrane-fusion protein)